MKTEFNGDTFELNRGYTVGEYLEELSGEEASAAADDSAYEADADLGAFETEPEIDDVLDSDYNPFEDERTARPSMMGYLLGREARGSARAKRMRAYRTGDLKKPVRKAKKKQKGQKTSPLYGFLSMGGAEKAAVILGVITLILAVSVGTVYAHAVTADRYLDDFADIGTQLKGVEALGGDGIVAVSDAQLAKKLAAEQALLEAQAAASLADAEEEKEEESNEVSVIMTLTTVQSDIKIKFINYDTNRRVKGVPFEVLITDPDGSEKVYDDHDQDGIIYLKDLKPGTYKVRMRALPLDYTQYKISTETLKIKVKETIEYKGIDIVDEIKSESEVNVAKEDHKKEETPVESVNKDTVEWVESTKREVSPGTQNAITQGGTEYVRIEKSSIPDPLAVALTGGFLKLAGRSNGVDQVDPDPNLDPGNSSTDASGAATTESSTGGNEGNTGASDSSSHASTNDATGGGTSGDPGSGTGASDASSTASTDSATNASTQTPEATPEITLTPESSVIKAGENTTLYCRVTGLTDETVTWSIVSGNDIVRSDGGGKFTGLKEGIATVRATANGKTDLYKESKITVSGDAEKMNAQLKDNQGREVYIKDGSSYKLATNADYRKTDEFYVLTSSNKAYIYTGWQTLDGKTYYFDKNGNKITGEQVINGAKYTFGSDGALSASSGNLGIDVSKWNGNIDWGAVRNSGVSYVIIRCGYRGMDTGALIEDPKFRQNIQGASSAGLKVGVYFFSQAINEVEAVEEASMAISLCRNYRLTYPIFLDVESGGRANGIGVDMRTKVCKAFCATVSNAGYKAGVYANKTWFNSYINTPELTGYKLWLAQYAAAPSYTRTRYDMWQYSSKGRVSGISGNVDMNISYLGY